MTLAWAVTGATTLSIDQGVGSVTPVTNGNASAQVTATTTFILTATNSGGTSTSTAKVTVAAPMTVTGTVTDEEGILAAGETVLITSGTFSQSTMSDANGAFSVASVPTPYNATVIDSGGKVAVQYQGLTRPDPTLFDVTSVPTTETATIAGALTGGSYPQASGYSTYVRFGSPQVVIGDGSLPLVSNGPDYAGAVSWLEPSSTTGTLYALQIHSPSPGDVPTDYPGYGTVSGVMLEDGASYTGQTIPLSAVTTGTISGTVTAPTGYTLTGQEILFEPAAGIYIPLLDVSTSSSSFSFTTPDIPNTSMIFLAAIKGTATDLSILKAAVSANDTGLSLSVPAPPTLTLPVDMATGVTVTTPFSWTGFTGVSFLIVTGDITFVVVTAASTVTLPDLTSAGLPLPTSTMYSWQLYGVGPSATVDAWAVPGGLIGLIYAEGYFAESVQRSFTTAP